jgi:hypothetical protein
MVMGFGDKVELIPLPHKPALDFMDAYFTHLRANPELQPAQ